MNAEQDQSWSTLTSICEKAMQSVSEKVAATWPSVRFRSGYNSNPAFPLRLWGSFTDPLREDVEGVDISIDFKWGGQVVEVTADVAYESGKVLSELPMHLIPLKDGSLVEDKACEVAASVSNYVQEQWKLIGEALNQ
jgi:hypothetical protein